MAPLSFDEMVEEGKRISLFPFVFYYVIEGRRSRDVFDNFVETWE
jgi:hypothetical protein